MTVDESPPNTDLKKKRRKRFIYLVVAAVLWYVITYGLYEKFVGIAFIDGKNPGIYWLMFHRTPLNIVAITPVVVILAALIIPGFLLEKYPSLLLSVVILFSLFVVSIAALTMFGPSIPSIHHVQTVQYGDHVYHLAERIRRIKRLHHACWQQASDPDCIEAEFTHEYYVYQCGWLGVVCHRIGYKALDEQIWRSHGKLSVNAEGSIVLTVDSR